MKLSEMRQVVDMLYDEWDLGKSSSNAIGKTCAWIYLFGILEESEKIVIGKIDKKVVGICGYSKNDTKNKVMYHFLGNMLRHSPLVKNKEELLRYDKNYDYTPDDLKSSFDGELSILIVDKKYRGRGIGKKILYKTLYDAKNDGIKKLQILTDESCDFKFYESCGCQKIYEKRISNIEPDKCKDSIGEMGYIYIKNFES